MTNTELYTLNEQLQKDIVSELPEGGLGVNEKNGVVQNQMERIQQTLQTATAQYDSQKASGVAEVESIGDYTLKVFSMAFEISGGFGYEKLQDRILSAQKMTDVIMKKASPMREKQEEFAEFADGYVIKNSYLFFEGLQGEPVVQAYLAKAFAKACKAYSDPQTEREQMPIPALSEQVTSVVPPVLEERKLNAPVNTK